MKFIKSQFTGFILYLIIIALIVAGLCSISYSMQFINNEVYENIELIRSYKTDNPPVFFQMKFITKDAFVAGNPINITINTIGDMNDYAHLELQFIGSEQYFLEHGNSSRYREIGYLLIEIEKTEELKEDLLRTHVALVRYNYSKDSVYFEGTINDVVYNTGGDYDVGITVRKYGEFYKGYFVGDDDYIIEDAIHISPPENLIFMRTNQLMIGLAWIAIGISLLIPGISGLIAVLNDVRKKDDN